MGKARVSGRNVHLLLHSQDLLAPIPLGEIDTFKAKSRTSIIVSRPNGYINQGATVQYGGWDLSFEGGKVDWSLAHFYWLQDQELRSGNLLPKFFITETVFHYNGAIENYVYGNVTLYGLDLSRSSQEVKDSIHGFSPFRNMGAIDDTIRHDMTSLIREGVFRTSKNSPNSLTNFMTNRFF